MTAATYILLLLEMIQQINKLYETGRASESFIRRTTGHS